jgi:hypothetical protein
VFKYPENTKTCGKLLLDAECFLFSVQRLFETFFASLSGRRHACRLLCKAAVAVIRVVMCQQSLVKFPKPNLMEIHSLIVMCELIDGYIHGEANPQISQLSLRKCQKVRTNSCEWDYEPQSMSRRKGVLRQRLNKAF